jgi:hypothetical protein
VTQHIGPAYCCLGRDQIPSSPNSVEKITVTDQHATAAAGPVFPPGRYGRRRAERPPRRWLTALILGLVLAASLGVGYRLYLQYGVQDYAPRILAETERTPDRVTIRFEVRSRDPSRAAVCRVRARASDGLVVGSAEVPVPAAKRVVQTYTLVTTQRAFAVDIPNCWPA